MAQNFTPTEVTGTTNVKQDNINSRVNENTLRSTFSGTDFPLTPVVGQQFYQISTNRLYAYNGTTWQDIDKNTAIETDITNAKGGLTNLTSYLRVSHNDDGTLKTTPATAVDEFKDNSLVVTYVSVNSFTVPNDLTSIFTTHRAIKAYLSVSTTISYVLSSSYDSETNKTTVVLTSNVLDNTLTAIKYGIIQYGLPDNIPNYDTIHIRKNSTAYNLDDIAYSINLPSWSILVCTTAGTTNATEPTWGTVTEGQEVMDGTVKWRVSNVSGNNTTISEATGYGIISGGNVTVSNMIATVNKLVAHMPDGKRYERPQTTITIQTADATNPRIDLIYLSDAGVVTYLVGTALSTPTAPTLPSGGLSLATIRVTANATTGTATDKRTFKSRYTNAGIVNIKDFGAKGDGVTDDTYAIQLAIKYAESLAIPGTGVNGHLITYNGESQQVYFPAGNYLISSTIVISVPHISLVGTPYAQPYGIQPGYTDIGGSNLIKSATFTGTSMVRMNGQYCSAHFLHLIGIPNQTVTRTVKGFESTYGGLSFIRCFVYGCTYGYDVAGGMVKLEFCTSNYNLIGVKIHGDSRVVECEISMSGLKLIGAPNEMSTTGIFTALDGKISDSTLAYYYGTGVWIDGNGANSQIIGGLIEWNRIGIWSDGASGTIVNGTRFDHNSDNHILMFMRPDSTASGLGFNISGCRFLAGGFLATKTGSNYSAITITDATDSGRKGFGNISSNTFRLGNWSPGENSDTVTDSDPTAGPRINAIVIQCNSYVDINVASNDMSQCSLYGIARINAWGGKVNIGRFNSNKSNKPVTTVTNNAICLFNGESFVYGRPVYTPVDSAYDKFPTSRNNDSSSAAWDKYEYRNGVWYGFNQRSIPDRTANPTTLSGQAVSEGDVGYIYYHTTANSLVKYNGTNWIKLTDGTIMA